MGTLCACLPRPPGATPNVSEPMKSTKTAGLFALQCLCHVTEFTKIQHLQCWETCYVIRRTPVPNYRSDYRIRFAIQLLMIRTMIGLWIRLTISGISLSVMYKITYFLQKQIFDTMAGIPKFQNFVQHKRKHACSNVLWHMVAHMPHCCLTYNSLWFGSTSAVFICIS